MYCKNTLSKEKKFTIGITISETLAEEKDDSEFKKCRKVANIFTILPLYPELKQRFEKKRQLLKFQLVITVEFSYEPLRNWPSTLFLKTKPIRA